MAALTVDVADELAEEFNRLFANVDPDAVVTTLLVDWLDRIRRLPSARQVIADNTGLPTVFVPDLLEARAEERQSAMPFLPGIQPLVLAGDT
ncbi:MAG: hypothetical protein V5B34_11040 [Accumulibacter sp.]|jgi:hypothetical protein